MSEVQSNLPMTVFDIPPDPDDHDDVDFPDPDDLELDAVPEREGDDAAAHKHDHGATT
jgi:hypothetical protein